ncbi:MAG: T9SS type A sorting domain-containing protein [Bacteroidales bacterium]|nr:T9SS type A sorting domain-containing protein [Bacteroidales bacterium]
MKRFLLIITIITFVSRNFGYGQTDGFGVTNGGNSGATVTVNNEVDFQSYAGSGSPYIIRIDGTIDVGSGVNVTSNKTIMGIDENSTIIGPINISNGSNNVIVKYLNITNPSGDGITIREGSHVYVSHCTVYDCGDGCIDVTVQSDFVTISYCRFFYEDVSVHKFANLIGASDTDTLDRGKLHVTFHHNWWDRGCDSRMPRARFGRVHMYNNYFSCRDNNYASRSRIEAQIFSEYNYYDSIRDPFTVEDGGIAKSIGNIYYKCYNSIYPGTDSVFSPDYSYSYTSAECAKKEVMFMAGNIPQDRIFKGTITRKTDYESLVIVQNVEMDSIQYSWINADSVDAIGLPTGITTVKNFNTNTLKLQGIPTDTGMFIITIASIGCAVGDTRIDTIKVLDSSTGIKNLMGYNTAALVFPNPSNKKCTISLEQLNDKINEVIVYDVNGKLVYRQSFSNNPLININHNLNQGIYILQVIGQNGIYFNKLLVKDI